MITKAIILGKDVSANTYSVRIPFFESAGGSQSVFNATLSTQPSLKEEYKEGDIVFVGFEDHHIENVIILGRLYLLEQEEPRGFANLESINIANEAKLPSNTLIGGIKGEDLEKLVRKSYAFANIPDAPSDDGDYILCSKVEDGTIIYCWSTSGIPEFEPISYSEAMDILRGQ